MGARGRGPDNAVAEGFLGGLREGFLHKRGFVGVSTDGLVGMLDEYMIWYRDKRIKTEYGTSIMDR